MGDLGFHLKGVACVPSAVGPLQEELCRGSSLFVFLKIDLVSFSFPYKFKIFLF